MTRPDAVLDAPGVGSALERSADPHLARAALSRILEEQPDLAAELRDDRLVRDALIAIACASRSLVAALVSDPGLVQPLRDAEGFPRERSTVDFTRALAPVGDPDALRHAKRREYLRIAARDLLGVADLPTVGRELAALAEACLGTALTLAGEGTEVPLAVIGMGKLGGHELNYASDVDVLFVHRGDQEAADHVARRVLAIMAEPTPAGIVFRTDPDLRPEGRAGPLSRSLDGFRAWYERWALTWEFQALIKARPVAGDAGLGAGFTELIGPFVWPDVLGVGAVRAVRAMKVRSEGETHRRGLEDRELKRGRGGIRDIEFAVQLLQLVHGRQDVTIRSGNTLEALTQLVAAGYVTERDAVPFDAAYRFLRTVEHRLQLWDEQQTHTLPTDTAARTRLARVLGYRDQERATALAQLDAEHRFHQARVRSIHEKLFFGPLLEALSGRAGTLSTLAAEDRLTSLGYLDLRATRAALDELTRGFTRTSKLMEQLLPLLLEWCSASPDPDLALLQLRRLAEGPARAANLALVFRDTPGAAQRTCQLLGSSRMLGDALRRQPEFVQTLGDDHALAARKPRGRFVDEAVAAVEWRAADSTARRSGLRRYKRRELLRVAARDLLSFANLVETGRDLSTLAEACLEASLVSLAPKVPFAVIGMGRFGGRDLSYASDLDVLFVYEGAGPADFNEAERVAEALLVEIGERTTEGRTFAIDATLRPEGRQGSLTRSLAGFERYWERYGLTWEFQALVKARPAAGDAELGARFAELAMPFVYRETFPEEAVREVRRMKVRIEQERIPPGEDPQFHLKLGRGSLSDIEFAVQLLQLEHGRAHESLRTPETMSALEALVAVDILDPGDAGALRESFEFCSVARNARFLATGSERESLPTDAAEAERVARLLGYLERPQASLRDDYRRLTRHARQVVERVFYGRE
ncbi:MAG TPA: bifunctional [glutamine synthetase] adenylyltransferase/[glutamine synthetase]-adenylyl-L-tyrosine phosphorylase [Acidimicrobiia bacterium]